MPNLVIRRMLREDVPTVCEIDRLCFALPWSENAFLGEATNTCGYYRVAELEGEIAGYLGAQMVMDEAHITTFGVRPELRRRGVGERLLAEMLAEAVRRGCRRITLEVRERNTEAQRLYRKYGFQPVSRRRRYYPDNDEDAIVMWIEDATRPGFRERLAERLAELRAGDRE